MFSYSSPSSNSSSGLLKNYEQANKDAYITNLQSWNYEQSHDYSPNYGKGPSIIYVCRERGGGLWFSNGCYINMSLGESGYKVLWGAELK